MKALVTGGGGFLGLYITEQLVARGDDVRVLCRGEYPRLGELGVEVVRGDVRDAALVEAACQDREAVFHVAAVPGIWGSWDKFHSINTVGTLNVIEACQKAVASKLIYTSSPSVIYDGREHLGADESIAYPDSYLCHYPHTKRLAEEAVLKANGESGLATCSLRPHLIWGPRDNHLIPRLVRRAKSRRLLRVGDGNNLISMSYVENAAAAHLKAADALTADSPVGGQAYFINEPEPVNLWSWVDQLLVLAGMAPIRRKISAQGAHRIGACCETVYKILRLPGEPPMTRFLAAQLSSSHYYSVEKARRDFGYDPQISIEEGMRRIQPDLAVLADT
ncbi:MAG: 3-beta hydroxysteroid dehydrogenase [Planctomycetaceae bacterium]|nr:3-beta hydroxysteroid dehydrogenase [Planctomycetaceae bacterium]